MTRCTAKPNGYADTFCEAMSKAVNIRSSKNQKGLFISEIVNIKTNERLGSMVYLVTSDHKNGIAFNLCPFCGGELMDQSKFDKQGTKP